MPSVHSLIKIVHSFIDILVTILVPYILKSSQRITTNSEHTMAVMINLINDKKLVYRAR